MYRRTRNVRKPLDFEKTKFKIEILEHLYALVVVKTNPRPIARAATARVPYKYGDSVKYIHYTNNDVYTINAFTSRIHVYGKHNMLYA